MSFQVKVAVKVVKAEPTAKAPYSGKVYGKIWSVLATQTKEATRKELVPYLAKKLHLTNNQVDFALRVMQTATHKNNHGRSYNASTVRGMIWVKAGAK